MRNGQVLTSGSGLSTRNVDVTNQQQPNNKEEMKNRENLMKKTEQLLTTSEVVKKPTVEKITSFSDPVPAAKVTKEPAKEEPPSTAPTISNNTKAIVLQSSRVASGRIESETSKPASNRITLSRKPPVWREKPRIPIKPQSVAPQPTVEAIPSALHPPSKSKTTETQQIQPQMKVQATDSQPGQISVRFVHLSSGQNQDESAKSAVVPSLVPAPKSPQIDKKLSALQRLDLLGSTVSNTEPAVVPLPEQSPSLSLPEVEETISVKIITECLTAPEVVVPPRSPSPVVVETEINNNPIKVDHPEPDKELQNQPVECARPPQSPRKAEEAEKTLKTDCFSSDARSSSTRGLTRSAFEALRANLAGTLELSRVCQPPRSSPSVNGTKRQAPPTPQLRDPEESSTDAESITPVSPTPVTPSSPPATPVMSCPSPSPPIPPALPVSEPITIPKSESPPSSIETIIRPTDRAVSASPRYRNSYICTSPEGSLETSLDEEDHPRSISLTRVERTDSQSMSTKPPSIRKILKERATHFLQLAEGGGGCGGGSSSSRLSRSDRFAAESGGTVKKPKGRFSLRKLLGLKKDPGWDEPAEPLPPKIRPEIVHPIDFHPVGQVQVVAGKVDTTDNRIGRSPAHDSISSTDSGRHSSTDLQRSDSSLGSSDCPSPANSHQSASYKNGSLKGSLK